jgi:uncharacterized membrane protein AbrB (regulator of aidB expression)
VMIPRWHQYLKNITRVFWLARDHGKVLTHVGAQYWRIMAVVLTIAATLQTTLLSHFILPSSEGWAGDI